MAMILDDQPSASQILEYFSFMAVEEFLIRKNMHSTLTSFRDEWERPSDDISILSWYETAFKLRLPDMIALGSTENSVLENILLALIHDSSRRNRRKIDITVSGLAPKPRPSIARNLTVAVSSSRPSSSSVALAATPSPVLKDVKGATTSPVSAQISRKNSASTLGDVQDMSRSPSPLKQLGGKGNKTKKVTMQDASSPAGGRRSPHIRLIQKQLERKTCGKMSQEGWIPDVVRLHSINRDFAVIHSVVSDLKLVESTRMRQSRLDRITDIQKAHIDESLGTVKKIPCGCCRFMFYGINLPQRVSMKAIVDIQVKWSGNLNSESVFGRASPTKMSPATTQVLDLKASSGSALQKTRRDNFSKSKSLPTLPNSADNESLPLSGLPPRYYDEVPVCVFCSQFFTVPEKYRPSFDKLYDDEKMEALQEARRREKAYWDPLKISEQIREEEERLEQLEQLEQLQT